MEIIEFNEGTEELKEKTISMFIKMKEKENVIKKKELMKLKRKILSLFIEIKKEEKKERNRKRNRRIYKEKDK